MGSRSGAFPELSFTVLLVSATVEQSPASVSLDRLPYLLRCGWSHLVIDGITLAVVRFLMHELDSVRLSSGLPPTFGTLLCSCPLTGSRTPNLQCFQTRSPGNRPWARDLSEYEFLRKYSQKKLITKQESRIWKGKKKKKKNTQKKASKSLGSDKVLVSAWFCRSSEAINYTWCLFHPVPRELGFFTPASVIESVTLATRLGWSGRLIINSLALPAGLFS